MRGARPVQRAHARARGAALRGARPGCGLLQHPRAAAHEHHLLIAFLSRDSCSTGCDIKTFKRGLGAGVSGGSL